MEFKPGQRVEMIKSSYNNGSRGYIRAISPANGFVEVIWDKPVVAKDIAGNLVEHKTTMVNPDMIKVVPEDAAVLQMPKVADFAKYRKERPIKSLVDVIKDRLSNMTWKERMDRRGQKHRG